MAIIGNIPYFQTNPYFITDVVTKEGWKKVGNTDPMWFPWASQTLRRRVGQRLRRKLGRILMQEEFEQVMHPIRPGWSDHGFSHCFGNLWAKWVRPSWLRKKQNMSRYLRGYFSISRTGIWNDYQDHHYLKGSLLNVMSTYVDSYALLYRHFLWHPPTSIYFFNRAPQMIVSYGKWEHAPPKRIIWACFHGHNG